MSHSMTKAEREAFLADVHVGVVAISEPGRGPLAVPIWYDYEPGGVVWFVTPRDSLKGLAIEVGRRISLCAQMEERPYKYVSIEGPVISAESADIDEHMRPMAQRYLGEAQGRDYAEDKRAAFEGGTRIVVLVSPERWFSVDYGKD